MFVSSTGYFNIIALDHMKNLKNIAFVENLGHFHLTRSDGLKWIAEFKVARRLLDIESVVSEIDFFVLSTVHFKIIALDHMKNCKDIAFVGNTNTPRILLSVRLCFRAGFLNADRARQSRAYIFHYAKTCMPGALATSGWPRTLHTHGNVSHTACGGVCRASCHHLFEIGCWQPSPSGSSATWTPSVIIRCTFSEVWTT